MKTFACIVALLLLTTPLYAAMGAYTTTSAYRTITLGAYSARVSTAVVDAANTKIYLEITGTSIAATMDAAACVVVGVAAATSTAADWMSSDIAFISLTTSANTVTPTATITDASCKAASNTGKFCSFVGFNAAVTTTPTSPSTIEGGQNWVWITGTTAAGDRAMYSTGVLKIEIQRPNAATDGAPIDQAFTPSTGKIEVYYQPTACPTVDGDLSGANMGWVDLSSVASGTYPISTGTGTGTTTTTGTTTKSFGNLTYLSWIALLISYVLLN